MTEDEIGIRAYSSSIAAIAAYPRKITSAREVAALPGCDVKLANLWSEWRSNDGVIGIVKDADEDEMLRVLRLFYNIWGVGASTAQNFYHRGWRDLDDVVEHGWHTLTRVQQIGVKYYNDLSIPIPRSEVEAITAVVRQAAISVRDDGIEICVVGGYRRGKAHSGDVDVVVSHRNLSATARLVTDIVAALERSGHISHTLLLSLTSTERGQATLPHRSRPAAGGRRAGFDTLDKALLVWQHPTSPPITQTGSSSPLAAQGQHSATKMDSAESRPLPRRRVDVIVSPWRTAGCAVLGWSGGTTFQRDLRRHARKTKGWKFDSSGIRDRESGELVALEGPDGVGGSMEDAEKVVFLGLGLEYREPWERCTG